MAKSGKDNKAQARLPKGFGDASADDLRAQWRMIETIRRVYESYGFEPLETPAIEYTEALGKFLPDQDRPNAGVFSFQDEDEQWLSLRYDLTAPLARYVAEGLKEQKLSLPFRRYAFGPVWRNEKPGPGRFRQFMQFDADTVGTDNIAADAEICMLAADTLEALGIPRGQYVVKVNNRKVLDGLMEVLGLGGDAKAWAASYCSARDRQVGSLARTKAFVQLLGEGRKDESGDFTKGAELQADQIEAASCSYLVKQVRCSLGAGENASGWSATFRVTWKKLVDGSDNGQRQGVAELEQMASPAVAPRATDTTESAIDSDRASADWSITPVPCSRPRSPPEVKNEDGQLVRFGSVGGGGRYDGLVERFLGRRCRPPASRSACRGCRRRSPRSADRMQAQPVGRSSCSSWIRASCRFTRS